MNNDHSDGYQAKDTLLNALLIGGIAIGGALLAVTQGVQSVMA